MSERIWITGLNNFHLDAVFLMPLAIMTLRFSRSCNTKTNLITDLAQVKAHPLLVLKHFYDRKVMLSSTSIDVSCLQIFSENCIDLYQILYSAFLCKVLNFPLHLTVDLFLDFDFVGFWNLKQDIFGWISQCCRTGLLCQY